MNKIKTNRGGMRAAMLMAALAAPGCGGASTAAGGIARPAQAPSLAGIASWSFDEQRGSQAV